MNTTVKKLSIVFAAQSDIGLVRTENQDSFGKFPEDNTSLYGVKAQLFVVADGMGGHKGGKEASSIAVKVVGSEFLNSAFEESVALKESIEKANYTIFNKAGDSSEFGRMGTTLSALVLKGEKGIIGHVGDSRIYLIENNKIEQLTEDHTKVQEMLKEGILTPEEARNYPSKSVLARALGVDENVRVDIITDINLKKGQSFLLCSDGLAKVSKNEILPIVSNNSPADACRILIDMANERGGKDNVTVIIVRIDPDYSVKIPESRPVQKEVQPKIRKKGRRWDRRWIGISAIFIILALMLVSFLEFKDYIFSASSGENKTEYNNTSTNVNTKQNPSVSNDELLAKANDLLRKRDYDNALDTYEKILDAEPMHQGALKGVNDIAAAYLSNANNLFYAGRFEEAIIFYKKVEALQPENEIVKNRIKLCTSQLGFKPHIDSSAVPETLPVTVESGSQITATKFDAPGWNYPGINKDEFSIRSNELDFTNTLSSKFIIYNKDLFNVTIVVSVIPANQNSTIGLVIGFSSPSDYYIFKHKSGGEYILQKVEGNNTTNLLVIKPDKSEKPDINLLKVQYANNLISIYNENGLLSTYKSIWGIFGKAGLYIDKNSSAKFQNIFLNGKTTLE